MVIIVIRFNPIIVAVGEGGEGQAIGSRAFGHATAGEDGGDKCDMRSQENEALGELEARIDMALGRMCYEEEVGADHVFSGQMGLVYSNYELIESYIKDGDMGAMTFAVTIWRSAFVLQSSSTFQQKDKVRSILNNMHS